MPYSLKNRQLHIVLLDLNNHENEINVAERTQENNDNFRGKFKSFKYYIKNNNNNYNNNNYNNNNNVCLYKVSTLSIQKYCY